MPSQSSMPTRVGWSRRNYWSGWSHVTGVMVPDDFLPQARRFGLMPTIDRFMVARGIELARRAAGSQ